MKVIITKTTNYSIKIEREIQSLEDLYNLYVEFGKENLILEFSSSEHCDIEIYDGYRE